MSEFYDTLARARAAISTVNRVGAHLDGLGIKAGVEMFDAADELEACLEVFKRLDGEAIHQRLQDAQQGTANMLAVAIGMARLADEKADANV